MKYNYDFKLEFNEVPRTTYSQARYLLDEFNMYLEDDYGLTLREVVAVNKFRNDNNDMVIIHAADGTSDVWIRCAINFETDDPKYVEARIRKTLLKLKSKEINIKFLGSDLLRKGWRKEGVSLKGVDNDIFFK